MKKRRLTVWIHKKNIAAAVGMMVSVILISQILRDSGMREVRELSRPALSQGQETESMIVVREKVAAGGFHSLGLTKDGTVVAAGLDLDGQCHGKHERYLCGHRVQQL